MVFKNDSCSNCGKLNIMIPSNNKLVPDLCEHCVTEQLDYRNIEDADFFCRTFNYPFHPEKWMMVSKMYKKDTFKEYISWIIDDNPDENNYEDKNQDFWKEVNKEWQVSLAHEELIDRIAPIKQDYILRNRIKWGGDYVFNELIYLENLFVNTLKANAVSNPMQIDAIKKACRLSVALDRAITTGESKSINELSKSYQNFVKTAQIDDIITNASKDVISNVSELVAYIEEQGFEMPYYDGVERDVVDISMNDIKDYLRRLVIDNTGLEAEFEHINKSWRKEKEIQADAKSYEKVPIDVIMDKYTDEQNADTDAELEREDIDEEFFDDDEEGLYFDDDE
jgi:hypothetical protein